MPIGIIDEMRAKIKTRGQEEKVSDLRRAFANFKDRYHRQVQTETELDYCSDDKLASLENRLKTFTAQAVEAEQELMKMLTERA